ncbi:MAG: 50S ribosomal protein L29 [Candidatus Moranbacteria bacterium]|nr:50S ribosomal protein L29 [Candidatus Moranbacteria bacterium]
MKAQELREKSLIEKEKFLAESRASLRALRFEIAGQQTKSHRAYRSLKKDIARTLTLMREI